MEETREITTIDILRTTLEINIQVSPAARPTPLTGSSFD
jgi:hypothetical protein